MDFEEGLEQGQHDNHPKIQEKLAQDTVDILFNVAHKKQEKKIIQALPCMPEWLGFSSFFLEKRTLFRNTIRKGGIYP